MEEVIVSMKARRLNVGITYDVKEDYSFDAADWRHTDFSTLMEIDYIKHLFEKNGHTVSLIGNYEKLYSSIVENSLPPIDIVFNTAEGVGSRNREGWIPSLLEVSKIPYTGTDALGLSISLSKSLTKIIAQHIGVRTPAFFEINTLSDARNASAALTGPWVLKPNYEGSSSGVVLVSNSKALILESEALLREYNQTILCETYISGREANVSVLFDGVKSKVIGTVEVVRKSGEPIEIFNAQDKFTSTCTKIPAKFQKATIDEMEHSTIALHRYLGCYDYNRADFRVDSQGMPYFLELNPLPSLDEESGFARCCKYSNHDLGSVLDEILFNALTRTRSIKLLKKP
jgi:D-alanine-D-alanine ligase